MKKRFVMLALMLLLSFITACANTQNQNKEEDVLAGSDHQQAKEIYKENCIRCHANDLSGLVGAESDLRKVGERLTSQQIADIITNGGDIMPSFKDRLQAEEIEALAEWLSERR